MEPLYLEDMGPKTIETLGLIEYSTSGGFPKLYLYPKYNVEDVLEALRSPPRKLGGPHNRPVRVWEGDTNDLKIVGKQERSPDDNFREELLPFWIENATLREVSIARGLSKLAEYSSDSLQVRFETPFGYIARGKYLREGLFQYEPALRGNHGERDVGFGLEDEFLRLRDQVKVGHVIEKAAYVLRKYSRPPKFIHSDRLAESLQNLLFPKNVVSLILHDNGISSHEMVFEAGNGGNGNIGFCSNGGKMTAFVYDFEFSKIGRPNNLMENLKHTKRQISEGNCGCFRNMGEMEYFEDLFGKGDRKLVDLERGLLTFFYFVAWGNLFPLLPYVMDRSRGQLAFVKTLIQENKNLAANSLGFNCWGDMEDAPLQPHGPALEVMTDIQNGIGGRELGSTNEPSNELIVGRRHLPDGLNFIK